MISAEEYYLIDKENIIARAYFSFYSINKACIVVYVLALNVDMIFSSFICAFKQNFNSRIQLLFARILNIKFCYIDT